jgi:hypothetical protein
MSYSGGHRDGGESLRETFAPRTTTVFELLADEERQVLVQYLLSRSEPTVDVAALVGVLVDSFGYDRSHAVMRLRHDHLPQLAAHRFLEYDRERSLVRFDEQADHADHDALRTLLQTAAELPSS